jgi:hypothetical protein
VRALWGTWETPSGVSFGQEIWNVSIGLEWVPGGFRRCGLDRFRPFIPVADNGSFAIRQSQ